MSRASGSGSFGYGPNIHDLSQSEFDIDARRTLDGLGPSKQKLTAEQVKQAFEEAQREDEAQRDRLASQQAADAFIEGHPEFIDNTENAQLLLNQVETMFGKGLHTVAQWEHAYEYLRTNTNFLKLDQKELAKQQKEAARQRYEATKARSAVRRFNPNTEYENLSLEELRDRANEELQVAGEQQGAAGF